MTDPVTSPPPSTTPPGQQPPPSATPPGAPQATPPTDPATTTPTEPAKPQTALGTEAKPPEAKPGEEAKPNELLGAPAEGKYAEFKLADGYVADPEAMTGFSKLAADIGLSQVGAQKIVDMYSQLQQKQSESWVGQVTKWGEEAKADKEFGGAAYDANLKIARGALDKFASKELREQLDFSGFGNHPEFIRFAYKVGKALGEATTAGGETPGGEGRTAADILFGGTKP